MWSRCWRSSATKAGPENLAIPIIALVVVGGAFCVLIVTRAQAKASNMHPSSKLPFAQSCDMSYRLKSLRRVM